MEKLIEMTMDGRLSLVWVFVAFLVVVGVYEAWPWLVERHYDRVRRIRRAKFRR